MLFLLPLSVLLLFVSVATPYRSALRAYGFLTIYLWCEMVGLIVAFGLWLTKPWLPNYWALNRRLQLIWAKALQDGGSLAFDITFSVEDTSPLDGPAAIFLPRHNSLADTVLPMNFYSAEAGVPLRYVLKQELLWDPCLDIVGNRVPNYFIDRSGTESESEIARLADFVSNLPNNEGLVFYPEGTRFNPEKREQIRAKAGNTDLGKRMDRYPDLLPPRLGGTVAVLNSNPGHDLLFCCHTGFGGAATLSGLLRGAWTHAHVRLMFWRVSYEEYAAAESPASFLEDQWVRMQRELELLRE